MKWLASESTQHDLFLTKKTPWTFCTIDNFQGFVLKISGRSMVAIRVDFANLSEKLFLKSPPDGAANISKCSWIRLALICAHSTAETQSYLASIEWDGSPNI
jgi:hypothetical protein